MTLTKYLYYTTTLKIKIPWLKITNWICYQLTNLLFVISTMFCHNDINIIGVISKLLVKVDFFFD